MTNYESWTKKIEDNAEGARRIMNQFDDNPEGQKHILREFMKEHMFKVLQVRGSAALIVEWYEKLYGKEAASQMCLYKTNKALYEALAEFEPAKPGADCQFCGETNENYPETVV